MIRKNSTSFRLAFGTGFAMPEYSFTEHKDGFIPVGDMFIENIKGDKVYFTCSIPDKEIVCRVSEEHEYTGNLGGFIPDCVSLAFKSNLDIPWVEKLMEKIPEENEIVTIETVFTDGVFYFMGVYSATPLDTLVFTYARRKNFVAQCRVFYLTAFEGYIDDGSQRIIIGKDDISDIAISFGLTAHKAWNNLFGDLRLYGDLLFYRIDGRKETKRILNSILKILREEKKREEKRRGEGYLANVGTLS